MIESEVAAWPGVTVRPMFGMRSFYRDGAIFAAVPGTRTLGTPHAIIFRFDPLPPALAQRAKSDPRIAFERPGARWYSFELTRADELGDALWWLNHAWQATRKPAARRGRAAR